MKLFPTQVYCGHGVYHSNRKETWMPPIPYLPIHVCSSICLTIYLPTHPPPANLSCCYARIYVLSLIVRFCTWYLRGVRWFTLYNILQLTGVGRHIDITSVRCRTQQGILRGAEDSPMVICLLGADGSWKSNEPFMTLAAETEDFWAAGIMFARKSRSGEVTALGFSLGTRKLPRRYQKVDT